MRNRILLLMAMVASCTLAISCTKDGDGRKTIRYGKKYAPIKNLDIVGAEYLYITNSEADLSTTNTRSSSLKIEVAQLFKILSDGKTVEVSVIDSNGEKIPIENIKIWPATDDLIYFSYSYRAGTYTIDNQYDNPNRDTGGLTRYTFYYFVRKSDGTVFEIPDKFSRAVLNAPKDKNQNLYCPIEGTPIYNTRSFGKAATGTLEDIYKIESKSGVVATEIVRDVPPIGTGGSYYDRSRIKWTVDWSGNVLYINNFGNLRCITPNGDDFVLDVSALWNDSEERNTTILTKEGWKYIPVKNIRVVDKLVPIRRGTDGGFYSSNWNDQGFRLFHCMINEQNKNIDITDLGDCPEGEWITLDDRIVVVGLRGDGVTTIKSPTDIKTVACQTPSNQHYTTKGDYIYWVENNQVYQLDYIAGNTTTLLQLNSSWEYGDFLFAEDLIVFYAIDRPNEKTYLCEIKNGVYSQTEKTGAIHESTAPKIIDFIRIN